MTLQCGNEVCARNEVLKGVRNSTGFMKSKLVFHSHDQLRHSSSSQNSLTIVCGSLTYSGSPKVKWQRPSRRRPSPLFPLTSSFSPHQQPLERESMDPDPPTKSTSGKSGPSRRRSARLQEARSSSSSLSLARPPQGGRRGGDQEGAAPSSSAPSPVAAVAPGPPPPRFDESIINAAYSRNWPRVIELHEEGISLDSRGVVRLLSHYLHHPP